MYDYTKYPAYFLLQAQVTREFRHFSIYLGGENLTNYKISDPIVNAHHPWSSAFDATQIWGPVTGAMAYIGIRYKFEKLYSAETADEFHLNEYDYIVDAIDSLKDKADLILRATALIDLK